MADDRNENRLEDRSDQNQELTDNFRFLLSNPNGRTYKQEAIMMGFGLMSGERDELIEYIKALKTLAIYLTGTTKVTPEILSKEYFEKAEHSFPEYLRKEMNISVQGEG